MNTLENKKLKEPLTREDEIKVQKITEGMREISDMAIGMTFSLDTTKMIIKLVKALITNYYPKFTCLFEISGKPNYSSNRDVVKFSIIDKESGGTITMKDAVIKYNDKFRN